jgi:hypothetical protein
VRCVSRLSLLLATVALICALPVAVGASTVGVPTPLAPPFDSAVASRNAAASFAGSGEFGANASAPEATRIVSAEADATLFKSWTADYTGTAEVTATFMVSGSLSATATTNLASPGTTGSAKVVSRLIGHLSAGGASRKVLVAKLAATCQVSGSPCVTQKSTPVLTTSTATLKFSVRTGVRYAIGVGVTARVTGAVKPFNIGSVAGDACMSGDGITCAQGSATKESFPTLVITRLA